MLQRIAQLLQLMSHTFSCRILGRVPICQLLKLNLVALTMPGKSASPASIGLHSQSPGLTCIKHVARMMTRQLSAAQRRGTSGEVRQVCLSRLE